MGCVWGLEFVPFLFHWSYMDKNGAYLDFLIGLPLTLNVILISREQNSMKVKKTGKDLSHIGGQKNRPII